MATIYIHVFFSYEENNMKICRLVWVSKILSDVLFLQGTREFAGLVGKPGCVEDCLVSVHVPR